MKLDKENKKGKNNGLIVTLVVHVALVLLFCVIGFTIVKPSLAGVEIGFEALGNPNAGGESAAEASHSESDGAENEQQEESAPDQITPQDQEVASQDESPVEVKSSPNTQKVQPKDPVKKVDKKDEVKEKKETERNPDPNLTNLMSGALSGDDKTGKGKGKGEMLGQQGTENGSPNGNNGGEGGQYDIGGVRAIGIPKLHNDCKVTGRIKVKIKVDRDGNVLDGVEVVGGSTQNSCLQDLARAYAKQLKYEANKNRSVVTRGEVEFNFSLN